MTAPDALDLRALGIGADDTELVAVASAEPAIVAEAALREIVKKPQRRRAGPLRGGERTLIVGEAISALRRDLFSLLLATEHLGEVSGALAQAGLALRTYPPAADTLAETLRRQL